MESLFRHVAPEGQEKSTVVYCWHGNEWQVGRQEQDTVTEGLTKESLLCCLGIGCTGQFSLPWSALIQGQGWVFLHNDWMCHQVSLSVPQPLWFPSTPVPG